ncbi:unnamed protein product [Ostreobium quekettii]|uniref:Serine incorporator n=1 Tax=Ostreobium quekettii TaxID=121088 RepID=A0A8S1J848_9CHLO|nr:unnamed protein product [Ostreobium quekettii]|eukprot:evm.model.scf_879.1 EVM.evm.TU.scf_879.1   scf_879:33880-37458(-)
MDICCCCCLGGYTASFNTAKFMYLGLFVVSAIVSWVFRDYGNEFVHQLPEMEACRPNDDEGLNSDCVGKGAVLRISFATFTFHLAHMIALFGCKSEADPRTAVHTSCFGLKFSAWMLLVFVSFFIPNEFFGVYGEVARVFSGVFLIFQAIVLIDIVYRINEALLSKEGCMAGLIAISTSLYILSLIIIALSYHFYAPRGTCSTNVGWITWTLIMAIAYTALSISPWRIENAGLLTSGAVFIYTSYLLINALASEPTDDSNPCVTEGGMDGEWIQATGFVIALAAVVVSTVSTGTGDLSIDSGDGLPYRPDFFHVTFSLAAMYLAMLFTNWSLEETPEEWELGKGWQSAWVKIASQWLVVLLYIWTMIAPVLLPDREFSWA